MTTYFSTLFCIAFALDFLNQGVVGSEAETCFEGGSCWILAKSRDDCCYNHATYSLECDIKGECKDGAVPLVQEVQLDTTTTQVALAQQPKKWENFDILLTPAICVVGILVLVCCFCGCLQGFRTVFCCDDSTEFDVERRRNQDLMERRQLRSLASTSERINSQIPDDLESDNVDALSLYSVTLPTQPQHSTHLTLASQSQHSTHPTLASQPQYSINTHLTSPLANDTSLSSRNRDSLAVHIDGDLPPPEIFRELPPPEIFRDLPPPEISRDCPPPDYSEVVTDSSRFPSSQDINILLDDMEPNPPSYEIAVRNSSR